MNDTPARIFVGLKVAPDIARELVEFAAGFKELCVRPVAATDIHLTLVPPWQERSTDQAIARLRNTACMFAPFSLKFQHLGYGPQPERPRLLWAECAATDEIAALRLALMQAFGQTDARPFRPHVTVARIRAAEHDFARRHPIDRCLDFVQLVRTIELFRSPPPGATGYHILASIDLDSPRASAVTDALINH